jgi:hypothetical protein
MSRPLFTLIWVAFVVLVLAGMWWGWRARSRRDADVLGAATAPAGTVVAEFPRAYYVSTTPVGEPLSRVAAPGLRYRGYAEVTVREDGVTVEVRGERPVQLAAGQLRGSGSAGRRVGKAVEPGGLALLRWSAGERELESSFRFDDRAEQRRFAEAVDRISPPPTSPTQTTSQEGTR